jgi:8-oxo-dGTP pyrophosphatase MutT (NUDIX family)
MSVGAESAAIAAALRASDAPGSFFAEAKRRLNPAATVPSDRFLELDLNPNWDDWPDFTAFRDAAVLIPVVDRQPEPRVILTQRTSTLPSHPGQIAFPGGKIDPEDAGPEAAAVREAFEEIGLRRGEIETLGHLDPFVTLAGWRIFPVVGRVSPDHRLVVSTEEVAAVFEVPLSYLMAPGTHRVNSRHWEGRERRFYDFPFEDYRIWGITAGIIRRLYEKIFA